MTSLASSQTLRLHRGQKAVDALLADMSKRDFVRRFLAKDATLWKPDEEHARVVKNRMGWLEVAGRMIDRAAELKGFASELRDEGVRHVVLLGMGGSSLCPDVLRQTFRRKPGYPALMVLDTTDPEAIGAVNRAIDPSKSIFIVSSKSGSTIEVQTLYAHYAALAGKAAAKAGGGRRFVAITDPGTALEQMARDAGFRRIFTNPPDIGGRYSALSCFGMVPAACLGIDIVKLLERGDRMVRSLQPAHPIQDCAPVVLGAALGAMGLAGRDKVTFFASPAISTFGYWVEQLIAESTGKEGKGLVPVEGETPAAPPVYGKDRLFVHLKLRTSPDSTIERRLSALRRAGHPTITIHLEDLHDLGGEFNRWEIATAVAGATLGIDPFDEPNVKESKDNTARVLDEYRATRVLPVTPPDLEQEEVKAWTTVPLLPARGHHPPDPLRRLMGGWCATVRKGDYIAIMAYMKMDAPTLARLGRLRLKLRARCRAATTLGFGPRFLHSTGQLHKGGAGNGVFLQITCDKKHDVAIPGEKYSFGVLQAAQAAGDYLSLSGRGFRVVRLHLGANPLKDLDKVIAAVNR